jgi:hypothetical protein
MVNLIDKTYEGESAVQTLFSNNPNDPRDSPDRMMFNGTVAVVRLYHDTDYFSKFAVLDIFPSKDITNLGTAVETLIEWDNIAYFYLTQNDYDNDHMHMVYYDESWKRKEVIVDHTAAGVMSIAVDGNDLD